MTRHCKRKKVQQSSTNVNLWLQDIHIRVGYSSSLPLYLPVLTGNPSSSEYLMICLSSTISPSPPSPDPHTIPNVGAYLILLLIRFANASISSNDPWLKQRKCFYHKPRVTKYKCIYYVRIINDS